MKVFFFRSDIDRFDSLTLSDEGDFGRFDDFDGSGRPLRWSPVEAEVNSDSPGVEGMGLGDFPYLEPHVPVFSEEALNTLRGLISGRAEYYPLVSCEGKFFVINVNCVDGALDEERSQIERFASSGRVMRVKRHVFRPEKVRGAHIFKITQTPMTDVFVSEEFVSIVGAANLRGFRKEIAWEG